MLFVREVLLLLVDAPLGAGREVKTRWFCVTSNLPLSLTRAAEGCPTNVLHFGPKYAAIRIALCKLDTRASLASRSEAHNHALPNASSVEKAEGFRIVYSSTIVRTERPHFRLSCS